MRFPGKAVLGAAEKQFGGSSSGTPKTLLPVTRETNADGGRASLTGTASSGGQGGFGGFAAQAEAFAGSAQGATFSSCLR